MVSMHAFTFLFSLFFSFLFLRGLLCVSFHESEAQSATSDINQPVSLPFSNSDQSRKMGHIELNMFQRTLLFLSLPILVPVLGTAYLTMLAVNKVQELTASEDSPVVNPDSDRTHTGDPVSESNCFHKLYKFASDGDRDGFSRVLNALGIDDDLGRQRVLSQVSTQKNTLLHVVSGSSGSLDMAELLVELHPPLLFEVNKNGDTALHVAAKEGKTCLAEKLVFCSLSRGHGLDVESGVPLLCRTQNEDGNTALHEALIHRHEDVAEVLINKDDLVCHTANKDRKSPLYLAAQQGYVNLVKQMKEKADDSNRHDVQGKSPIFAAILSRKTEILEILSTMDLTTAEQKDEKGRSPLHFAVFTGYLDGVRFLLSKSTSDVYTCDKNGSFPIHTASSKGFTDIIDEFLSRCPDSREILNQSGQNILHVAAKCGRDSAIRYMLKNRDLKKLLNERDNNGDTPLHLAAKNRHPKAASTLTWAKGIKLNVVNDEDLTVLDITEGNMENFTSFHGRLTWIALKSAGAERAENLHILLRKKEQSNSTEQLTSLDHLLGLHAKALKFPSPDSFKDRVNTLMVVAILVSTVTFAAGFTMPGGYMSSGGPNQGSAVLLTKYGFQAFVICDTIAMYSSIIVSVALIWAQLGDLNLVLSALRLAIPLLGLALTMMSLAFTAGVYVVVSSLRWLAVAVFGLGMGFLGIVLCLFVPLFFPSSSTFRIIRYLTYYPFRLAVFASGNYSKDLEE